MANQTILPMMTVTAAAEVGVRIDRRIDVDMTVPTMMMDQLKATRPPVLLLPLTKPVKAP